MKHPVKLSQIVRKKLLKLSEFNLLISLGFPVFNLTMLRFLVCIHHFCGRIDTCNVDHTDIKVNTLKVVQIDNFLKILVC